MLIQSGKVLYSLLMIGALIVANAGVTPSAGARSISPARSISAPITAAPTATATTATPASRLCVSPTPPAPTYRLFLPLIQRSGSLLFAAEIDRGGDHTLDRSFANEAPLQTGVLTDTIDPQRAAILRGVVCDRSGALLSGVSISVPAHPEYGTALTDTDGQFSLTVNGGGSLVVNYAKAGYFPAQRSVQTQWQSYAWLSDVALVQPDTHVTTVDLTSPQMQAARGSLTTDADGTRQATVLFAPGTQAQMVLTNGVTQTLTTLNVRATEYTVGERGPAAMPAELPAASGYTYALEYSVDEALAANAVDVRFSQPVLHYVENFLEFPIGMAVPTGYYDRQAGRWIGSENGRVVKIIDEAGGLANLDTDGDGVADNGSVITPTMALTITIAERQQLAALYQAGQSLWRVPLTHFTPWDCNWPFGPPLDARAPREPDEPLPRNQISPRDNPDTQCRSIVECQNQVLGEVLPLVGTAYGLSYRSDRTQKTAGAYTIDIPLSGSQPPDSLEQIELEIYVAGQRHVSRYPAQPNLSTSFTWDGKDAYGNPVSGKQPIQVRVGYTYGVVYYSPANFTVAWDMVGSAPLSANRGRMDMTIWRHWQGAVGAWSAASLGFGGWQLSAQHAYDAPGKTLYLGSGRRRTLSAPDLNVIKTAWINNNIFSGVLAMPDGSVLAAQVQVVGGSGGRVIRILPDGTIEPFAGNLNCWACNPNQGDGQPATSVLLTQPYGLALGPDGSVYISEAGAFGMNRVRRVGTDGLITTVAGNGTAGFSGDGGPATQAQLNNPLDVAVDADGNLYIADLNNSRVRRVGTDGIITTFAGCDFCAEVDGVPATQSLVPGPVGLAVGPDGSVYIAASHKVRRVAPDGLITTFAGGGTDPQNNGDGGLATLATINPYKLASAPDGTLFIAEVTANRVRRVGVDGIITTFAGSGSRAGIDEIPAVAARLTPQDASVSPDGRLFLTDSASLRVRYVQSSLPDTSVAEIVLPSEDGREVYVFDSHGRHRRTLDAVTGRVQQQFNYDAPGRLISLNDEGRVTTINRDAGGRALSLTGPFGHVSTFTYDANGYLAAVTNPAGETVQLTHTADGLLTQLRDARQNLHTFTYDAAGRLIRDADPMGGSLELAANSITTTVTTALGRVTAYGSISASTGERRTTRQADGAISTQESRADGTRRAQSADGSVVTTTLGPDPRWGMLTPINTLLTTTLPGGLSMRTQVTRSVTLITVTQPFSVSQLNESISVNNRTTLRSYNVSQRTLTTKTAAGRSITVTFDAQDRVTSLRRGDLAPVFFGYDATGLISGTQGAGAEARTLYFVYDSAGNLTGVIDPLGRSIGFGYDAAGRVITHTLPDGQVVHYAYNANGQLSSITPPDRPAHAFEYTAIDQIERITPPDVTAGDDRTQLTYNVDRQLTGIQRPDGQAIALNYDAAGRLINTVLPAAAITYTYASSGDVVQLDRSGGANVSRTYDGFLLTGETWSGPVAGTVTRTTNADLNVTAIGVNGAAPITYQYDADDLLTRAGALTVTRSTQNGLIMGSTLGGVSDAWQYNAFAEPVSYTARYTSTPVLAVRYQRDAIGRITAITETVAGATRVITYAYDLAGRLIGATGAQYTYDANGNRLSVTDVNGARTATYDAQDRLLNFGGAAYTYTAAGEMKTKTIGGQTTAYTYDALGNLIHVTLPAGTTIDYVIDGDDRRVGKRVNGVLVKGWLYEDRTGIAAELDGNNNVVSRFVYGASGHVPDYLLRDGHTYRLITDPLGSVRLVVDVNTGDIVQRLDYDAFGRVLTDTQPGFQPFGFAGGLYDPDTGLVRFGLRDYDAEMGRWTAKDPIGFAGGDTNLYAYVENDPINRHDPLGLWSMEGSIYAGLGVGGKLAVSMEGISFCYEVGLGAGGGVSVDPLEGIDRDSMSVVGELGFKAWIFGGGGKVELDDCGNLVGEGKGCVGPFCGKRKYDALGNEQPQNGFEVSSDVLETINVGREGGVKGLKEMYKNVGFKLEGKVAAKFCVQHKW